MTKTMMTTMATTILVQFGFKWEINSGFNCSFRAEVDANLGVLLRVLLPHFCGFGLTMAIVLW